MAVAEIRWLELDRSLRKRVARSVRGGRPGEPGDVAVAIGYCVATLEWLHQRNRLRPLQLLVAAVLVADLLLTWEWPVIPAAGAVLGLGIVRLRTPRLRRRLATALNANLAAAADSGVAPVRIRLPGSSWLRPGTRRRRLLRVLEGALALLALGALTTAFLPHNGPWAARADGVCAREQTRLERLDAFGLPYDAALERRAAIERDALVALERIDGRTHLASELIVWRRYEVELDAWLAASLGDPRVPAEQAHRAEARRHARSLARQVGAETCARV